MFTFVFANNYFTSSNFIFYSANALVNKYIPIIQSCYGYSITLQVAVSMKSTFNVDVLFVYSSTILLYKKNSPISSPSKSALNGAHIPGFIFILLLYVGIIFKYISLYLCNEGYLFNITYSPFIGFLYTISPIYKSTSSKGVY